MSDVKGDDIVTNCKENVLLFSKSGNDKCSSCQYRPYCTNLAISKLSTDAHPFNDNGEKHNEVIWDEGIWS